MTGRRSGKSLIELMVVIVVLSVVLTVTAQLLAAMMRADVRSRDAVAERTQRQRLTQQFRDDAHAAQSAELLDDRPDEPGIVFVFAAAEPVAYRAAGDRILRIVGEGDPERVADRLRLSSAEAQFAVDAEGRWAELILRPIVDESRPARGTRLDGETVVRAGLGRDLRFRSSTAEAE